jgi:hypothetical protein
MLRAEKRERPAPKESSHCCRMIAPLRRGDTSKHNLVQTGAVPYDHDHTGGTPDATSVGFSCDRNNGFHQQFGQPLSNKNWNPVGPYSIPAAKQSDCMKFSTARSVLFVPIGADERLSCRGLLQATSWPKPLCSSASSGDGLPKATVAASMCVTPQIRHSNA